MPEEIVLRAEKLDGFEHLSDEAWATMIADAVRRVEAEARAERGPKGLRVLGRKAILRANPTDSPATVEPRRNLRPHVACGRESARIAALGALVAFRRAHHAARQAYLAGDHAVVFPFGTYGFKLLGARTATAPPD